MLLGQGRHRLPGVLQAARCHGIAVAPGPGGGGTVRARCPGGQLVLGELGDLAQGGHPPRGVALGAAAVEALEAQQGALVGGHVGGGDRDRGVGDDAARGDVALLGEGVAQLPQGLDGAQRAAAADLVQPGGAAPGVHARGRLEAAQRVELLAGPLGLAGLLELGGQQVAQLHEDLDVEGGVLQPGLRQRARRPVDGRVLLLHPAAQQGLHQRGEPDAGVAQQAAGELGVEELGGGEPLVAQAGEVLGGGVQDPLGVADGLLQRGQPVEGDRVDQVGAGALAAQLDEVGAVGVAVARGALGVDRDRAGAAGDGLADRLQGLGGLHDRRHRLAQSQQRGLLRLLLGRGRVGVGVLGLLGLVGLLGVVGDGRLAHLISGHAVRAGSASPRPRRGPGAARRRCTSARPTPRRAGWCRG